MASNERLVELLKLIKALAAKGWPGYYIERSFLPNETLSVSIQAQEIFFLIKTVRADLSVMNITEQEKESLSSYLNELEAITFSDEHEKILLSARDKIDSVIDRVVKSKTNEGTESKD
ncbi:MAG: hypothetical protein U0U70_15230 [Chitinophagaceae bacterium]